MHTVGQLDKDHPGVIGQGQQDLLEIFGLCSAGTGIDDSRDLGKPIYDVGDLRAKSPFNIFQGDFSIFYSIVQEGSNSGAYPQANFFHADLRYS